MLWYTHTHNVIGETGGPKHKDQGVNATEAWSPCLLFTSGLQYRDLEFVSLNSCQIQCQEPPTPGTLTVTPLIHPWQASPINHTLSSTTHMADSSLTPHSMQPLSIYIDTRDWIASQSQAYRFSCFQPSLCTFFQIDKHLQRHQTLDLSLETWYPVSALFLTLLFTSLITPEI